VNTQSVGDPSVPALVQLPQVRRQVWIDRQFEVFFDDLRLFRPIKFKGLPATNNALKSPLAFIGNRPVTQNPARSATNAGAASINLVCRISFATLFGAS
jgi:hypothetical protein